MPELAKLTWFDAEKIIKQGAIALLPVGSTEQHGPHLPLGTDWLTAEYLGKQFSANNDCLLLPTIPIGVSHHHRHFWGTLWVSPQTLKDYFMDIGKALKSHGVSKLIIINGHGGNNSALDEVCRELRELELYTFIYSWWLAIADFLPSMVESGGSHAGEAETSVMLEILPQGVVGERFYQAYKDGASEWGKKIIGVNVGYDTLDFTQSGATGKPQLANPEKGEKILKISTERLGEFVKWLKEQPLENLKIKEHLP